MAASSRTRACGRVYRSAARRRRISTARIARFASSSETAHAVLGSGLESDENLEACRGRVLHLLEERDGVDVISAGAALTDCRETGCVGVGDPGHDGDGDIDFARTRIVRVAQAGAFEKQIALGTARTRVRAGAREACRSVGVRLVGAGIPAPTRA